MPDDAADIGGFHVLSDAGGVRVRLEVVAEAVDVEPEFAGVAQQVGRLELVLVLEQQIVHRPECALGAGRL